ncbi:MAG: hypothetical protein Q9228_003071 [Teloschistes exilis]
MKELSVLQFNARVFCSTWLTRSWTFQEARLSRAWFAQFADGFYNPNPRANWVFHRRLYGDKNIYRSDAQALESDAIDWYHNVPAVRQKEAIKNQALRLLNDVAYTFITVWNQLCSRSTSKPEDVHGILANTLDLRAEEVLELPLQDRMKAILKAQESLPVSLIYSSDIKIKDPICHWVPLYPEQSRLSELGGSLTQTMDGFLLDTDHAKSVAFLVDPSLPRGDKIRLGYAKDADPLWITFNTESDGRPITWAASCDTLAVCYVVQNIQRALWDRSITLRSVGARFALRRFDGKTLHLVYEYSFLYSLHRRCGQEEDYIAVQAERTGEDAVFHIDCDLSSWPKLSYHRDTSSELTSHGVEFYTPFWFCYGLSLWPPFYCLAVLTSPSRPLLLPPAIIFIIRSIISFFEILRLREWISKHAYKAWVKTFDQSGSLKKRTERTDRTFLEIGTRIKRLGIVPHSFRLYMHGYQWSLFGDGKAGDHANAISFIEAATKTVNYAIAVKNAPEQVQNIIEQLRSIRPDLETYLGLLSIAQEGSDSFTRSSSQAIGQLVNPQDSSSPFLICFKEVEACIEKLTTSTESTQSKTETALRALKWPFKEKETQRMLASCASLRYRLHSALSVDHM